MYVIWKNRQHFRPDNRITTSTDMKGTVNVRSSSALARLYWRLLATLRLGEAQLKLVGIHLNQAPFRSQLHSKTSIQTRSLRCIILFVAVKGALKPPPTIRRWSAHLQSPVSNVVQMELRIDVSYQSQKPGHTQHI